jgi:hypothetical protein
MVTVTTLPTLPGADDNSHSTEKPDDGKAVKSGLGEAGGGATRLLTLTWARPWLPERMFSKLNSICMKLIHSRGRHPFSSLCCIW